MRRLVEIAKTGITALLLHPLRSLVTFLALLAILVPYLAGIGIAQGIQREAEASLEHGGDLYVSGEEFGRRSPVPLTLAAQIRDLEGVTQVTPRIIGRLLLGRESVDVVLVGVPQGRFPQSFTAINGRLPKTGGINEFVVGTELARRLKLKVGSLLPPFYHNRHGEHVSKIVGLFKSDVTLWQANVMFSTFETAEEIFDREGLATDLVVRCQTGYADNVGRAIRRISAITADDTANRLSLKTTSRTELRTLLAGAESHREGIFQLHFVLVFVIGILVILVTTGLGLPERRREIGILKATGWQTDEILFRSLVESLILSLGAACVGILIAFVWLKVFNGFWLAGIFIPGLSSSPGFSVPFRLTPVPAVLGFAVSFAITMSGTIWSTWRAAVVPPAEALR